MKAKKIFKQMIKEHNADNEVTYVSSYENIKEVMKMILSVPDTCIENIDLSSPEMAGYGKAFLLTYSTDNTVWCQKAFFDNGNITRGDGTYIIDVNAIGDSNPHDFLIDNMNQKIKLIGGETSES